MTVINTDCEVKLNPGEDRRLLAGHQWVFSNELQNVNTKIPAGTLCTVLSAEGKVLGSGFFNPHSLIAVRMLSRGATLPEDDFVETRVAAALEMRKRIGLERYGRMVFSEADFLPGLVIDRYGDLIVAELLTAGMDRLKDRVLDAISESFEPKGILLKNNNDYRRLEGLPLGVEKIGVVPEVAVAIEENIKYSFSPENSQKTGFYYDQRDNREFLTPYFKGRHVMDLYCYVGGFAIKAAASGAVASWGIDSSEKAVEFATKNAELNGLSDKVRFQREDAERALADLKKGNLPVPADMIILDPPNLVKSRKNLGAALKLYSRLNETAVRGLPPGGLLATSTCSHHVGREEFIGMLKTACAHSGRDVRLMELRGQAKDHPVLMSMAETEYLHFALLEVR